MRLVLFKLVSAIFIRSRNVDSHIVSSFMQVSLFWDFMVTWVTSEWLLSLLLRNGRFFIINLGGNFHVILRKVVVQVPLCSETSTAVWGFTLVRLLASVESKVSLEVPLFKKGFFTVFNWARIFFLSLVFVNVNLETLLAGVWFVAAIIWTDIFADFQMNFEVVLQVSLRIECLIAVRLWADKGFR